MDLRKSMYAVGGLIGVLVGRSTQDMGLADMGVVTENTASEGKVPVTGVASCGSLGLVVEGMMAGVVIVMR